ncbi:hypothetical protein C0J50_0642 [Silurus asotus]|uniref:Uncharacterized protein n=1 Tax=Silurus asotus TaxID=30991 RepID=A0AAD5A8G9_SILAS|nr:hypothetical protein C0J50_0642 [Silurus asotus]
MHALLHRARAPFDYRFARIIKKSRPASICAKPTDMIIRLGRLTPGYFRLLQRQVAGEVQTPPQDRSLNQIAMMLAIMGLSLSYYSAKQMTEKPINLFLLIVWLFNLPLVYHFLALTHHRRSLDYDAIDEKADGNKKYEVNVDETEGVSDVNMTENRDFPDHMIIIIFSLLVFYMVDVRSGYIH